MPRLSKAVRKSRTQTAPGARSRDSAAPGIDPATRVEPTPAHTESQITPEQLHAKIPTIEPLGSEPADTREAEPDGGGNVRDPLGPDPSAAPEPGIEGEPEHELSGEELIGMVKFGRELFIGLFAKFAKVSGPEVTALQKFDPDTLETLRAFAPAAARYMPFLNAHADLIGAIAFFGFVGFDTSSAFKEIKRLAAAERAKRETPSAQTTRNPNGRPPAPIPPPPFLPDAFKPRE